MNSFCFLLSLALSTVNLYSATVHKVDKRHFSRLYGRKLNDGEAHGLVRRNLRLYSYDEAQLKRYLMNDIMKKKAIAAAQNKGQGKYKDYISIKYTETLHTTLPKVDKVIDTNAFKKSETVYPVDDAGFPLDPQTEEESVQAPLVPRSTIYGTRSSNQGISANDFLLSQRDSRMFLKDRDMEPMDDGILAEMLANPAL